MAYMLYHIQLGIANITSCLQYAGRGLASDKRIRIYGILEQVEQHLEEPFMISGAM